MVTIEEVSQVTDELIAALDRLIPQLSTSSRPPTQDKLVKLIESSTCVLFIAREPDHNGQIVGTLTLAVYHTPTKIRAWIEDVVVDETARKRGIGTDLVQTALRRARIKGARAVDLTSRPSRKAANRLYSHLGFVKRDTGVYRYSFDRHNDDISNS